MKTFTEELTDLISKHSMENGSDTPDYILAQYLWACLVNFDLAVQRRELHHGRPTESPYPITGMATSDDLSSP